MPVKPTVSADETVPTPTSPAVVADAPTPNTRWDAFEKARLVPASITCDGALPFHRVNLGCHSKLLPKAESLLAHIVGDHGGGFLFEFRKTEGKPWPGWAELRDKGVELVNFTCNVCDKDVQLHPQHISKHMLSHSGKLRRPQMGGKFNLTLSLEKPTPSEDDAYSDF